jgi:hypothetical protein
MNQADSLSISYLRLISHALTEFFDAATSNITSTQMRIANLVGTVQ